jgi:hypothetical protein
MPPPKAPPSRAASAPSPSPWRQPKVPHVSERVADKAEAQRYSVRGKPKGKRPSEPETITDAEEEEEFDVEDNGMRLIEERDAMDAAAESADGRGWSREDTDRPQLWTVGSALNATIKAVHVNKHVDAYDLLYALLTDRTHVIFLFFDEEAIESNLHEGLVSIGYNGVTEDGEEVELTDAKWSLGFLRMLAELRKQRHCALVFGSLRLHPCQSESYHVGPEYWTENRQIGANSVSYSHHTTGTTCPFVIGVSSVGLAAVASDWGLRALPRCDGGNAH